MDDPIAFVRAEWPNLLEDDLIIKSYSPDQHLLMAKVIMNLNGQNAEKERI